jgi:site-specific recombinase XerD
MPACRPLSAAEVERVLLSFHGRFASRDRALFALGVLTGFRISELLSLTVANVLQDGRLVDYLTVARRRMKRKACSRTVRLHLQAQRLLRTWLLDLAQGAPLTPETYVFWSRKGRNRPISRRRALRLLQARFRALGMTGPLGTHSMRKTFAMGVHERLGNDLRKTQEALGQQDISSTIRYLQVVQAEIDRAVLSLELGGSPCLAPERSAWSASPQVGWTNGTTHHEMPGHEM